MNHILKLIGIWGVILLSHAGILAQDDGGDNQVQYYPIYAWGDRTLPVIPGRFNTDVIDLIPEKRMREYVETILRGRVCPDRSIIIAVFEQEELELHVTRQEGFKQEDFVREFEQVVLENRSTGEVLIPLANVQNYNFAENLATTLGDDCGGVSDESVDVGDFSASTLTSGNQNVRLVTITMANDATNPPTDAFGEIRSFLDGRQGQTSPFFFMAYTSRDPRFPSDISDFAALQQAERAFVRGGTFFTPGIWMTVGITVFLFIIFLCGVCWIMAIQSEQKLDDADEDETKKGK